MIFRYITHNAVRTRPVKRRLFYYHGWQVSFYTYTWTHIKYLQVINVTTEIELPDQLSSLNEISFTYVKDISNVVVTNDHNDDQNSDSLTIAFMKYR